MLPCSLKLKLQPAVLSPQRPVTSLPASFAFFKFFSFMHLRTLPSSVSSKSFACHSYENCRVCTNNSQSGTPRAPAGEPGPAEILLPSTSVSVNSMFSVDSVLIPASPHSPRFTDHCPISPIPFFFISLRTLLHLRKTQVFCFQAIPSSLHKTPGVGYTYLWLLSLIGRSLRTGRGVSLPTLPFSTFNCRLSTSSVPFFSCQPPLLFWKAKNERQPFMAATKRHTKEETHAVSHATVSARTVKRVFNFNAGPGALPLPVLERIREELLDWRGSGMSVMEMSHRSPEFESINAGAEQKLRNLLGISDDYAVIFVPGGGSKIGRAHV